MKLAAEHKAAPEHQKWMYDADPFLAKKTVEDRQIKATEKRDKATEKRDSAASTSRASSTISSSREFERCPEVKMAPDLRDIVEDAIKQVMNSLPLCSYK